MAAPHSTVRRTVLVVLGLALVVAGIAGFSFTNGIAADLGCAVAIVGGIGVLRYATHPKYRQVV